jgi:hypothetical protein
VINVVDLLWIEQRGMSIITAIFFFGVFITIGSLFWWMRREIGDIDAELANHKLRLNDTQKDISNLSVEIGKIRVTVENTEQMMGKLIDHILK